MGPVYIPGTELRGKNMVASRVSSFKKLLALTKIQWPLIMHRSAFMDVIYIHQIKKKIVQENNFVCTFTSQTRYSWLNKKAC